MSENLIKVTSCFGVSFSCDISKAVYLLQSNFVRASAVLYVHLFIISSFAASGRECYMIVSLLFLHTGYKDFRKLHTF